MIVGGKPRGSTMPRCRDDGDKRPAFHPVDPRVDENQLPGLLARGFVKNEGDQVGPYVSDAAGAPSFVQRAVNAKELALYCHGPMRRRSRVVAINYRLRYETRAAVMVRPRHDLGARHFVAKGTPDERHREPWCEAVQSAQSASRASFRLSETSAHGGTHRRIS